MRRLVCVGDAADWRVCGSSVRVKTGRGDDRPARRADLVTVISQRFGEMFFLDGREDQLLLAPVNVGQLPLDVLLKLPLRAVLQASQRVDRLGEVRQQQRVFDDVFLDRQQQFLRAVVGRTDQTDERPVAVKDRPQRRASRQRGLAASARHGEGEQPAVAHRLFDPADDAKVIIRPRPVEGRGEIGLAEHPERLAA